MGHNTGSAIRIEELVEHRDWAVKLARSLVGERGEPEALAQDALTAAWLRPPGDIRDLRAWLGALLRRRAATAFRATGRREEHEAGAARAILDEATDGVLIRADMHRRLVEHILALPEPEARVLLRRYFDGQSPAGIARGEGCAVSTIHNRLTRARQALRARLDQDGGHPHWMSALAPVPVRMIGRGATVGAPPWVLALGLKSAVAAGFAVAAVLALVFLRVPAGSSEGPPPVVIDGLPAVDDSDEEQISESLATLGVTTAEPKREVIAAPDAPALPDDGLLHGRLVERVGEALRPLAGVASIRVVSSADVEIQEHEGRADELLLTSFVSDESGAPVPVALQGEHHVAVEGDWSMPILESDGIVLDVTSGDRLYRPIEARLIPAGARSVIVVLQPVPHGTLVVLDEQGGPILSGISVRSEVDLSKVGRVTMSGSFLTSPRPKAFDMHRPPEAKDSAVWVCPDAASPVEIRSVDYKRNLWVGKEGYQWEKVEWPAGTSESRVTLREVGGLEVDLLTRAADHGRYRLSLHRGVEATVSWDRLGKSGVYRAEKIGAGSYELRVERQVNSHSRTIHRVPVVVVAGEVAKVALDLATLPRLPTGSLRVEVVPPREWTAWFQQISLSYSSIAEEPDPSFTGKRYRLRDLVLQDGVRVVGLLDVPVGRYAVEVNAVGALASCEVIEGEKTTVRLDLSELAELEVVKTLEGSIEATRSIGQVHWRHGDDSGGPFLGVRAARAANGRWTIRCMPGMVVLQATDRTGKPEGGAVTVEAYPGFQRVELDVDPGRTIAFILRVKGIPEDEYRALEREVRRALEAALLKAGASGRAVLSFRQLTEGLGRQALEGYVALDQPGSLTLDLMPEWRERLVGFPREIEIERGKPVEIQCSWADGAPK